MSNWYNEEKEILNIETYMSSVIPGELISGYEIDELWLTTFSLEYDQLNEILFGLDAIKLVAESKVHVYYDIFAKKSDENESQIISGEFLHAVNMGKYAFHPKVILCRYKKKDSNSIRYVIIVSSKNITGADNLDVYAVSYGDVGEKDSANGCQIAEFMKAFAEESFDELKKVDFRADGISDIHFLDARGVFKEIQGKDGLIVVSPFLSDALFSQIKSPALLFSTSEGFTSLGEEYIKEKTDIFRVYDNLHAKIYCYKKDENTCWVIGSSNATNNGCNVSGKSGNIEFNIGFTTSGSDYDDFEKLLKDYFSGYDIMQYNKAEKFNAREIFSEIFNNIFKNDGITCKYEDNQYSCCVELDCSDLNGIQVEFSVPGSEKNGNKFVSPKPMSELVITIKKGEHSETFALSLYDCWKDDSVKAQLDAKCCRNYVDILKHIQEQIIAGKSKRSISPGRKKESVKAAVNTGRRENISKKYVYENLMQLSYRKKDDSEFKDSLRDILNYTEMILKVDKDNRQQKDMQEILECFGK